jgi:hypothetical protein
MSERTLIHAGRLIDVDREEVVRDRVIVGEGDRIADVVAEAPAETSRPRSISPSTPCSRA